MFWFLTIFKTVSCHKAQTGLKTPGPLASPSQTLGSQVWPRYQGDMLQFYKKAEENTPLGPVFYLLALWGKSWQAQLTVSWEPVTPGSPESDSIGAPDPIPPTSPPHSCQCPLCVHRAWSPALPCPGFTQQPFRAPLLLTMLTHHARPATEPFSPCSCSGNTGLLSRGPTPKMFS